MGRREGLEGGERDEKKIDAVKMRVCFSEWERRKRGREEREEKKKKNNIILLQAAIINSKYESLPQQILRKLLF